MVINVTKEGMQPIVVHDMVVEHCDMYVNLGSPFISDDSILFVVKTETNLKLPHVLKFASFIEKNGGIP